METIQELLVPDIGDFRDVPIIEVHVQKGDTLTPESAVVTLESDKATMEVPAEAAGIVVELTVDEGDLVSEGTLLLRYRPETVSVKKAEKEITAAAVAEQESSREIREQFSSSPQPRQGDDAQKILPPTRKAGKSGPAGPAVRRMARELGVDLLQVTGTGGKGRITKDDLRAHIKTTMQSRDTTKPAETFLDFSKFGKVREKPLSRIQKLSGSQLAGNWATIPHVTSFDEADITDLDTLRKQLNKEQPVKLTPLAFVIKAVQKTLEEFPEVNSSIQGDNLVLKDYYHIGFAVDTPSGLLVAVIRDVNLKGVIEVAREIGELAGLARSGKLKTEQMQGGTFTISSLGSIGGTHFTPIINAPEVGILALGRGSMQPKWDGTQFVPRLILPLSLSWDHRALDGVTASKFNAYLCSLLADYRRVAL